MDPAAIDALEERVLEVQVDSMMKRIFGADKRSHDDIERDIRQDQYELGRVMRERKGGTSGVRKAAAEETVNNRQSSVICLVETLLSFEMGATTPLTPRYTQLAGLRSLVQCLSSRGDKGAALVMPSLEETARSAAEVSASWDRWMTKSAVSPGFAATVTHTLSAAAELLEGVQDVLGHDAQLALRWKRSLMHQSHSCTFTRLFTPPLPSPLCGVKMAHYLAFIATTVAAARLTVPTTLMERDVLRFGLSRVPEQPSVNSDGSARLRTDQDGSVVSLWNPQPPPPSDPRNHFLLLVTGKAFAVSLCSPQGSIYPLTEISRLISEALICAQSTGAKQSYLASSVLSSDDVTTTAREAYGHLRREILQLDCHARTTSMLETAAFVLSLDTGVSFYQLAAQCEVGNARQGSLLRYPYANRWLANALSIAVDREGQIELCVPSIMASQPHYACSLADRLSLALVRSLFLFDELASGDLPGGEEVYQTHMCVWSTGVIMRLLSLVPGKCVLCLLPEQMGAYAEEMQKLVPDENERHALQCATAIFKRAAKGDSSSAGFLKQFFEACRPYFTVVQHPTLRSPLEVTPNDPELARLLTTCIVNPFVRLKKLASLASAAEDDISRTTVAAVDVILEAIALTPPGPFKLSVLEKLEAYDVPIVDSGVQEWLDLFSSVPSKDARLKLIQAAGNVGYHVAYKSEVVAAVEDKAKKEFLRLLYTHGDLLDRKDPWKQRLKLSHIEAEHSKFNDVITSSSDVLLRASRAVSRFVIDSQPHVEDEALNLRFAHPDSCMRAFVSLAAQLALAHLVLPVTPAPGEGLEVLPQVFVGCANIFGDSRLVGGELLNLAELLELYYAFFFPRLCGGPKTADITAHRAMQITSNAVLRLVMHHYSPVEDDFHIKLVGAVQRPAAGHSGSSVGVDVAAFSKRLTKVFSDRRVGHTPVLAVAPVSRTASWTLHADMLDCAARVGPLTVSQPGCVISALNHPVVVAARSPLTTIRFLPTETLSLQTGDNEGAMLMRLRRMRFHYVHSALLNTQEERGASDLLVHMVRSRKVRYIDNHISEEIRVDIRGVWASEAFAAGFVDALQRCFQEIMSLWVQ